MTLKKQLTLYLKQSGMSASELARRADIPRKTLHNWSAGQKPRDFDQVKKVAGVIGCSLDDLVYGDGFQKAVSLLESETWVSGIYEIKIRRIKR